jgi:hypothetical protein
MVLEELARDNWAARRARRELAVVGSVEQLAWVAS